MLGTKMPKSRALSPMRRRWQSCGLVLACGVALGHAQAGTPPIPGGTLGTLTIGRYVCELPGDAMGDSGIPQPAEDFSVLHASTYEVQGTDGKAMRGTYLFWGGTLEITSGPKQGQRFRRVTPNLLRRLNADGNEGALRCIREVLNNR